MLYVQHLIFLNIRAHQTMVEKEWRQQREFKATQRLEKGMWQLFF